MGTWGSAALNPDFIAIDGYFGGVQIISAAGNSPITLTSPAGFTPTPTSGPTQAQNGVLRFTGALTGNVQITLPLPGFAIIENGTTGAFVLSFRAIGTGEVIGVPQGFLGHVYNDGTNVRFVKGLGEFPGKMDFLGGVSALPAWMSACTQPPFLIADGSVYNFSAFPALAALYLGTFGGNGITTFGVPDLRGRVPLAYDGTGARITVAGSGINGQTLGASADAQSVTLTAPQIPTINSSGLVVVAPANGNNIPQTSGNVSPGTAATSGQSVPQSSSGAWGNCTGSAQIQGTANVVSNSTGGQLHTNVQPSQVAGIWLCKT